MPAAPAVCDNSRVTDGPPPKKVYLMCGQCGTPCYVFETEGETITEALCLVCGNDEVRMFNIGEEAGPDDDER